MTRDSIIAWAKKRLLKGKEQGPIVFIATRDQSYNVPILDEQGWNTNARGRKIVLFELGRAFAQAEHLDAASVTDLYFLQEMWYVSRKVGEQLPDAPSEEADRHDALGLLHIHVEDEGITQTFGLAEILRHGGVVDLGPFEQHDEALSDLLMSVLAGISSASMSDAELKRFAEQQWNGKMKQ